MTAALKQVCIRYDGATVALDTTGKLHVRTVPKHNEAAKWEAVPAGFAIKQFALGPAGQVIALDGNGALHERVPDAGHRGPAPAPYTWRPIASLEA